MKPRQTTAWVDSFLSGLDCGYDVMSYLSSWLDSPSRMGLYPEIISQGNTLCPLRCFLLGVFYYSKRNETIAQRLLYMCQAP